MSVTYSPTSGSTIAFGDVVVGASSPSTIGLTTSNQATFFVRLNSDSFSGPDASLFSGGFFPPSSYGPSDSFSSSIIYSPTAIAAANATYTLLYQQSTDNGVHYSNVLTLTYTLTGTGIANPSPPPATEAASLLQSFRYLLVPSLGTTGKVLSYYDTTNFNDISDLSTYTFKAEDITADRVPTVRRVIITYIDLGVASLQVTVSSVNDNGAMVTGSATVTIGTVAASGNIATAFADLSVTGYRPQIRLTRSASGGPIAISHVLATGTIEKKVTL